MPRSRTTRALGALLAVTAVIAIPAAAGARTTIADLRVEGPDGKALEPGASFVTGGKVSVAKGSDRDGCPAAGGRVSLTGTTALGLLASGAQARSALDPVRVAEFSFGLLTCRVGEFGNVGFNGWVYRVNHKSPSAAAERKQIGRGDEVLWYYADFDAGINSGDELVVQAPARTKPGKVAVRVIAFKFDGTRQPVADGTVIRGGEAPVTTEDGRATVELGEGKATLRAVHRPDIPSAPVEVCVNADLAECPAARGGRVFGSAGKDRIPGTAGPDRVIARGGADRVVVAGGGADRVDCGPGRDTVVLGDEDSAKRCEVRSER